jgi:hypothetical protein
MSSHILFNDTIFFLKKSFQENQIQGSDWSEEERRRTATTYDPMWRDGEVPRHITLPFCFHRFILRDKMNKIRSHLHML